MIAVSFTIGHYGERWEAPIQIFIIELIVHFWMFRYEMAKI